MKFSSPITYNGFTATTPTKASARSPADGTRIRSVRFTDLDGLGYLAKRALDDGLDAGDVFMGGRGVVIDAAVYGSTEGRLWDNLAALTAAFDPVVCYNADSANRGFLAFDFLRPTAQTATWGGATIPQRMYLRPLAVPAYAVDEHRTGGVAAKGGAMPASIRLIARDPRIYLQSQSTISVSTSSQTVTHNGTHQVWPFLTFTMSGAGSSATVINIDGFSVKLDLSTVTTGVYSLNYATRHMTDSSGSSMDDLLFEGFDHRFRPIQPGGSVIIGTNLTNVAVVCAWRVAWL